MSITVNRGLESFGRNVAQRDLFNQYYQVGDTTATLWLIAPRKLETSYVRPYVYNLDRSFLTAAAQFVEKTKAMYTASFGGTIKDSVQELTQTCPHVLQPDSEAIVADTRQFSHNWTFILTIDNAPRIARNTTIKNNSRIVYSGIVLGSEPVLSQNGQTVYNFNALLAITHVDNVKVNQQLSQAGYRACANSYANLDVLNPDVVAMTSQGETRDFILDPSTVVSAPMPVLTSSGASMQHYLDTTLSGRQTNVSETALNNCPKNQLNGVMRSVATMAIGNDLTDFSAASSVEGTSTFFDEENITNDPYTQRYGFARQLSDMYSLPRDSFTGLDHEDRSLTLGKLLRDYPCLTQGDRITVIDLPYDAQRDVIDETAPSLSTIMSTLIKNAVPAILMDSQICDCTFRYCSTNTNTVGVSYINREPMYQLQEIKTFVPEEATVTAQRFTVALERLKTMCFKDIERLAGDFDVLISFHTTSGTIVQLQLFDYATNNGFTYTESILGGANSPLLGMNQHLSNHVAAMDNIIELVRHTNHGFAGREQFDVNRYNQSVGNDQVGGYSDQLLSDEPAYDATQIHLAANMNVPQGNPGYQQNPMSTATGARTFRMEQ